MPICLEIWLLLKKGKSNVKFDVRLFVYNVFVFMKKVNQKSNQNLKRFPKEKKQEEKLFSARLESKTFLNSMLSLSRKIAQNISTFEKNLHFRTSFSGLSDLFISLWILLNMITYLYHCCWGFLITNNQDLVMF